MNGLVIADDATGALECASLIAGLHLDVAVALSPASAAAGICVADSNSRHLPAQEAAATLRRWLQCAPSARIFKKTDSTLRGNIAAELTVLLEENPSSPVVYLPAYPALGRTVVNGRLLVHGVPVNETEFAADPRQPVRSATIADLFPAITVPIPNATALATELNDPRPRLLICDAATADDMDALAAVLSNHTARPPIASPAGFITAWAAFDDYPRRLPPAVPRVDNWLIVCGSLHPQSRRQARAAIALGLDVIQTSTGTARPPDAVARDLAQAALGRLTETRAKGVLVMGGDTVRALWRAMGIESLLPLPEVLPGVAACLAPGKDLLFVTKAGGFGDDRLVEQIMEKFK